MSDSVLFIDDEPNILKSIARVFADHDFRLYTASNAHDGLGILCREDIAVVVTDNIMPQMNGLELLRLAKEISPDTIRIMLTGYANLDTAMQAINYGEVFRFVIKPWDEVNLVRTVESALLRKRIVMQLQGGDELVMQAVSQAIELKDPYTRGHSDRVADYAIMIGRAMGLSGEIVREIKQGSWLHDCGKIGVPDSILQHDGPLDVEQYEIVKKHSLWGAEIARHAQLPSRVVNIILYHHEQFMGEGYPMGFSGVEIPLEARIVAVADVYDALTSDRPYRKAHGRDEVREILFGLRGRQLDPEIVSLFCTLTAVQAGENCGLRSPADLQTPAYQEVIS